MLLIWGTRPTERILGYVADYCPMCRDIRPFRLIRRGRASHLYYISFGSGKLFDHVIRCEECGVDIKQDPTRYVKVEKSRPAHLSDLIQATFPALPSMYAESLARDVEIRKNPRALPLDQREAMLLEPFRLLHLVVDAHYAKGTAMDKPAGIGCFGTLLVPALIIGITLWLQKEGPMADAPIVAAVTAFGLGGLYTFIQVGLAPGRFMRSQVIPKIARALAPLQPTEAELLHCLERCRSVEWVIGKKIKPKQILDEIERQQTPVPHSF